MSGSGGTSISPRKGRFRKLSRRSFIVLGGLGTAGVLSTLYFGSTNQGQSPPPMQQPSVVSPVQTVSEAEAIPDQMLDEFARFIIPAGPGKDLGIPAIDSPKFVSGDEADKFLSSEDAVFGLEYNGFVRAYPQIILVRHEIVNETLSGDRVSVTYCPLTGSAMAFRDFSRVDGAALTFGVSGNLVNSNLVMYDRQSDSNWPQILGAAVNGPNKGKILNHIPLVWTTWELWKKAHPETEVLSRDTGFARLYVSDPYGSYIPGNHYYRGALIGFPLMHTDDRLPPKKVVTGVMHRQSYLAIPKEEFKSVGIANTNVGREPILAIYDHSLDAMRVFSRRVGDRELTFRISGSTVTDGETNSEWSLKGEALTGILSGNKLRPMRSFEASWFAWVAFFPQTSVYG